MDFVYNPLLWFGIIVFITGVAYSIGLYIKRKRYRKPLDENKWVPAVAYSVGENTYKNGCHANTEDLQYRKHEKMLLRKMTVQYTVDGKSYTKSIPYRQENQVDIFYKISDPKQIHLATEVRTDKFRNGPNELKYSIAALVVGIIFVLLSMTFKTGY